MIDKQATSSLAFGAAIAFAGALGTPLGGWWLDRDVKRIWVRGASCKEFIARIDLTELFALYVRCFCRLHAHQHLLPHWTPKETRNVLHLRATPLIRIRARKRRRTACWS
jgi:hypothetical protein